MQKSILSFFARVSEKGEGPGSGRSNTPGTSNNENERSLLGPSAELKACFIFYYGIFRIFIMEYFEYLLWKIST